MVNGMAQAIAQWLLRKYYMAKAFRETSNTTFSTLISIPIAAELQAAAGTTAYVAFSGGILVLALLSILMARWACLNYKWIWKVKI